MTEAIAETDEGRERAKAAEARIKEFRAGGPEVESEEPAAKRARGSDESMVSEVPDSCAGAAQEPMEDDAEDRMEKQKRASGWEDLTERTKRQSKDDDDEDMLLEVACQDDFDETGLGRGVRGRAGGRGGVQRRPELHPKKVRQARNEELVERVYVEADVGRCVGVTGGKPIRVRWVDVDKGFGVYRSRLATPPLEVVKFLIMQADQVQAGRGAEGHADRHKQGPSVCAHRGEQYVDLAPERAKAGKCAKLLYGLRTAASSWQREYTQTLEAEGFVPGIASKCTFSPREDDEDRRTRR